MSHRIGWTAHRITTGLLLALLPLAGAGCILGVLASKTVGSPPVPARWTPPKEPTLVLVENYRTAARGDVDSDRLGQYITDELNDHKVAPLIDFDKVRLLRDQNPDAYRTMTIAQIGKAAGASQVIYVNLTDYDVSAPTASDMLKGHATAMVKVVDTATGQSRWPSDAADGEPISADTEYKERDPGDAQTAVRDELNKAISDKVGKLFHSWDPDSDENYGSSADIQK